MLKIKRTLAIAALALTTAAAFPALAADQAPAAAPAANPVEARIASLHDQLQITAAETDKWNAVARVMRGNAEHYARMVEQTRKKDATMTAVESLRAYERIATAHAAGVKKLAAAFETLYAAMSPAQWKLTDDVFRARRQQHAAGKAK